MNKKSNESPSQLSEKLNKLAKDEGVDRSELEANFSSQLTFGDKAKAKAADVATRVDESARSRPWYFIGAAAVVGFLVGRLSRR